MGILLVYDVTDDKSFGNIRNWIRNIDQHASEHVARLLVGNKCDLQERRVVETVRGQQLAAEYQLAFLETSAKSATNVDDAFVTLARTIKKRLDQSDRSAPTPPNDPSSNVKPGQQPASDARRCC